jgi:cell division septation protein DedD
MNSVIEKAHRSGLHLIHTQEHQHCEAPVYQLHKNIKSKINGDAQSHNYGQKLVWLTTGVVIGATSVVIGATIVILLWSANLHGLGVGVRVDPLQNKVSVQAQQIVEPQKGYINRESKAEILGDEIQIDSDSELEMLPPTATGEAKPSTLTDVNKNNSGTATSSDLETKSIQPTVDVEIQRQEPGRDLGTWAINLASSQQKVSAELFAAKVNSKGVAAEINQVTVREKTYWRVQVPGFSSRDEARTKVSEVQNKLGLKDVWIVQR